MHIGQGEGWCDIVPYRDNGLIVFEAKKFDQLAPMLRARRFHCLPLGIGEIETTLEKANAAFESGDPDKPTFSIASNLIVYYSITVYVGVGEQYPELYQRLDKGLREMANEGEIEKIFYKHHEEIIRSLNEKNNHYFHLKVKAETNNIAETPPILIDQGR